MNELEAHKKNALKPNLIFKVLSKVYGDSNWSIEDLMLSTGLEFKKATEILTQLLDAGLVKDLKGKYVCNKSDKVAKKTQPTRTIDSESEMNLVEVQLREKKVIL